MQLEVQLTHLASEDVVGTTVSGDGAQSGGTGRGIVGAKVLNNVVFDQWVPSPTINGEVAVAVGVILSSVCNSTGRTGVPSTSTLDFTLLQKWNWKGSEFVPFTTNPVAVAVPLNGVGAARTIGVGNAALSISPEGVVKAVVVASGAGCALSKSLVFGGDQGRSRDA